MRGKIPAVVLRRVIIRRLCRALAGIVGVTALGVAAPVLGAPFIGVGEAPAVAAEGAGGHREAIGRARRAALEAALATIEGAVDPQARATALANPEAWTSAFRIVRTQDDGATLTVEIEAEIDVQRLIKQLRPPAKHDDAPAARHGFRLGDVAVHECPDSDRVRAYLLDTLQQRRIVGPQGRATIGVQVRCRVVGAVPHSLLRAVRLDLDVTGVDETVGSHQGTGLAETDGGAAAVAVQRAVESLASRLRGPRAGEVVLRVEPVADSGRIRRLLRQVERSVVGVRGVTLDGVDGDGSILFVIQTDIDAAELARRIQAVPTADVAVKLVAVRQPNVVVVDVD